ncbi:DEAD/DEAH box helicase [Hyphobacterium sp. CCMP332]|nr:DEAD/DEAH box helicase [Hyphobacterium sp. CCMP332]
MKISPQNSFKVIYSLYQHEFLGHLFESYIVELDQEGRLSLKHQNISSQNAEEFRHGLDEIDYELIELMDVMNQETIVRKFYHKRVAPAEFFLKVFNKEKGDKPLQQAIAEFLDERRAKILKLLKDKLVFEMGNDGEPTANPLAVMKEKATVLFHFRRNEDNTHYFPTIKHMGEKLEFQYKGAQILCKKPAWMLLENNIYNFEKNVDGKKLIPFLNKKFIVIPKNLEDDYYKKFVAPLVASYDVYAKGFEIKVERDQPRAVLSIAEFEDSSPSMDLFQNSNGKENYNSKFLLQLKFRYNDYEINGDEKQSKSVKLSKEGEQFTFHKIMRKFDWEKERLERLLRLNLPLKNYKCLMPKSQFLAWLNQNKELLMDIGFIIQQTKKDEKRFFFGNSSLDIDISENNDWFDIRAKVQFGDFEIPFIELREHIMSKRREFRLPNGEYAVIPEEWFSNYSELFTFIDKENGSGITLKKHHLSLVNEMQSGNLAKVSMSKKLQQLRSFETIEEYELPEGFKGKLRPYQKAGYNWLRFLNKFRFGGCLADDMGLGKTIQTLALLQSLKENEGGTSILILPTSLVYNWMLEAKKFTPKLKIHPYVGTNRNKDISRFGDYDLILTSYGITRIDKDILKEFYFNYIILDESQAIKNPSSNIFQSVTDLKSSFKLTLTGTPLENSSLDIWSQMTFINPGLLGEQKFFKNEFLIPIEKNQDELKSHRLYTIIKPFILRRHKSQVAKELPPKTENVKYCDMTAEQEKKYEEAKSYYRNQILSHFETHGNGKSQIVLLQGLSKLRQLANHPSMVDDMYSEDSGKMETLRHMIESAVLEGHKILIFSQFVKHLSIVRKHLDKYAISYAYLDGTTKDRQGQVDLFQQNEDIKVFLISLKAGGTGLNLTAADYVFLLDPWWNPAVESQAIDRAHRIGQTQNVMIYRFITRNTVEEKILKLQKKKKKLAEELITTEEGMMKSLSKDDIESLLT